MDFVLVLVSLVHNTHTNAIVASLVSYLCDSSRALQLNVHQWRFRQSPAAGEDGYSSTLEGRNQRMNKKNCIKCFSTIHLHVLYKVR